MFTTMQCNNIFGDKNSRKYIMQLSSKNNLALVCTVNLFD